MYKYKEYLLQQRKRIQDSQHRIEPLRCFKENVELRTLAATGDPVKECYTPPFERLQASQCYKEFNLCDFSPADKICQATLD